MQDEFLEHLKIIKIIKKVINKFDFEITQLEHKHDDPNHGKIMIKYAKLDNGGENNK